MGSGATRIALCGVALATVAAVLGASTIASAAPPHPASTKETPSPDKARAAELFKKGAEAYNKGDFAKAIALLEEANAIDPQPVLVYNMARSHEGLGHTDEAITLYERYLSQEPTSPDRGAIEQRLTTLKRQKEERAAMEKQRWQLEQDRDKAEKERAAAAAADEPPRKRSIGPYIVGGVGVAGVLTGAIFGAMALGKESSGKDEPVQTKAIDDRDTGKTFATVSNIGFVLGGALVAAGVVWWVIDTPRSKKRGAGTPNVALGAGWVGLEGALP